MNGGGGASTVVVTRGWALLSCPPVTPVVWGHLLTVDLFTFFVSLEQTLPCFYSAGRVPRIFLWIGFAVLHDTFQRYPLSWCLTLFQPGCVRLRRVVVGTHRSYSDATFSVLVTFYLINTVCLWKLSIWPEVLPEWQCSAWGGGGVQYRCMLGQSRTGTWKSLCLVFQLWKKYFRWSNKQKLLAPVFWRLEIQGNGDWGSGRTYCF